MRGLEKGKNKGNKETRETTETKGMLDWGIDWETLKIM